VLDPNLLQAGALWELSTLVGESKETAIQQQQPPTPDSASEWGTSRASATPSSNITHQEQLEAQSSPIDELLQVEDANLRELFSYLIPKVS